MQASSVTVEFRTNRAETAPGIFGSDLRRPSPSDPRLYATGTVRAIYGSNFLEMVFDKRRPALGARNGAV
jgi:hypothetical protein